MFGNNPPPSTAADYDYNLDKKYLGVVEDVDDPLKLGRAKVRVEWLFGKEMPVEDLPWARPQYAMFFGQDGFCGQVSVPKVGAIVGVTFYNGDIYAPVYNGIIEYADDVLEQLQKEYFGTHIIGFDGDEDLKMYYTQGKGLTFYLKGSRVNISNDKSVTIEHADTSSIIELRGGTITMTTDSQINLTAGTRIKQSSSEVWADGKATRIGHEPQYAAVLGEPLFALLKGLAENIDAKMYPSPGVNAALVEQAKKITLSDTVKVSK